MSLPKITTLKLMKLHPETPVRPQPRDIVRDVCIVPGCGKDVHSQGRCVGHSKRKPRTL